MTTNKFIYRIITYMITFPVIVNIISFLEVSFVDREYLNDYFQYMKYVFSLIITIDLLYSKKHLGWVKNWLKVMLILLIVLNYFYGCIALIFLYLYGKIEVQH